MSGLVPLDASPNRKIPSDSSGRHEPDPHARPGLHWQSQAVLLMVLPAAGVWMVVLLLRQSLTASTGAALAVGTALALLVWGLRAATGAGALTGGLLMGCFCLTTPGWGSSGWAVFTMLALTLAATRIGHARKQQLDTAEGKRGRGAAQVAANLGVAALAGTLIDAHGQVVALTVLLAALAEAGADTLASELGQVLGGTPRLLTTLRPVAPGTDGGVTFAGTAIGALGAVVIAWVGMLTMAQPWTSAGIAAGAGTAGLLFDSLLGATLERAGWLNNDAVNFLSTIFAAAIALSVEKATH